MPRDELIRRLAELTPPTPAACFALLWLYFKSHGLTEAEDLLRKRRIHPTRLDLLDGYRKPPYGFPGRLETTLDELRTRTDPAERDAFALRWIKSLDRVLADEHAGRFERLEVAGEDGRIYRVRRRNAFVAEYFESRGFRVTWEAGQSRSLATYTPHHVVIPDQVGDVRIESRPESRWGHRFVHDRLRDERQRLTVMLWPLGTPIDYASLDILRSPDPPEFVSLRDVRNQDALRQEVREALKTARAHEVTLLIFPELAIPPEIEGELQILLAGPEHGRHGYPVLTLLGCCHRPNQTASLDLNEAVLLGPDGRELHRHRKLTSFTHYGSKGSILAAERLEAGRTVSVLECALGNLTPLICLDLFNHPLQEVLSQSHANLLAVPSLSHKTTAHQTAASSLQASNRASTFVSNRWIEGSVLGSFFQVPRPRGYTEHVPGGAPYLLFTLAPGGQSSKWQV